MKRTLLFATLGLLITVPSVAQTKVVKQVERVIKGDKPDFKQARTLIAGTLTNPETQNDPRAWFVAGQVEEKALQQDKIKASLGQEYNEENFYTALSQMVSYYLKADSLDALPDDRGRVRRKYEKEIKKSIEENGPFLINAGSYYLDKKDFVKANENFDKYLALKKLPMFEGTPMAQEDSMSMQIGFFSAYAASQIKDNTKNAIAAYERIKNVPYRQSDVYQLLAAEYQKANDSIMFAKTLEEGAQLFPQDQYLLFNLINVYIRKGEHDKAKSFLETAIANDPKNPQLYHVMGTLYEQSFKQPEKAREMFEKALSIDPEFADAVIGMGRIYYNQAVEVQSEANAISDQSKYDELHKKAQDLFRKSLPYFERAVEMEPDNTEYLMALRGIYYNLNMQDKMAEIEKKLGN